MVNFAAQAGAVAEGLAPVTSFNLVGPDGVERETSISELRDGFTQGYVFELLDTARGRDPILEVFVLVLNPRSYTLSEPFQVTLTPAESNTVISEQSGIIVREITIEGTFGLAKKTAKGFIGAQPGALTGTDHFQRLRSLFRRYSNLKKDPVTSATTQLIFHALRDDDHFRVEPRSFETPRDARSTRAHYDYRITMAAMPAQDSKLAYRIDPFVAIARGTIDIFQAFNDARAAYAQIIGAVDALRFKLEKVEAFLNNAALFLNITGEFLEGTAKLINFPLQAAVRIADQFEYGADRILAGANANTIGVLNEHARNMRHLAQSIDRIAMYPAKFKALGELGRAYSGEKKLTSNDIENNLAGANSGSRTRIASGSEGEAGYDPLFGSGIEVVTLSRSDTIDSLANRYATTPAAIVVINDLTPPYIAPGGGPGILAPGDTILVPVQGGAGTSTQPGDEYLTGEDALYGVDMKLDDAALKAGMLDIRVAETGDSLDCELCSGIANVVQGTQITVLTEYGSTSIIPELGIKRTAGSRGTMQEVLLASIRLREAILSDPRITGIQSLRVVLDGDVLTQEVTPLVAGRKSGTTLVLPFGRASSGG